MITPNNPPTNPKPTTPTNPPSRHRPFSFGRVARLSVLQTSGQTALSAHLSNGIDNASETAAALLRMRNTQASEVSQLKPGCKSGQRLAVMLRGWVEELDATAAARAAAIAEAEAAAAARAAARAAGAGRHSVSFVDPGGSGEGRVPSFSNGQRIKPFAARHGAGAAAAAAKQPRSPPGFVRTGSGAAAAVRSPKAAAGEAAAGVTTVVDGTSAVPTQAQISAAEWRGPVGLDSSGSAESNVEITPAARSVFDALAASDSQGAADGTAAGYARHSGRHSGVNTNSTVSAPMLSAAQWLVPADAQNRPTGPSELELVAVPPPVPQPPQLPEEPQQSDIAAALDSPTAPSSPPLQPRRDNYTRASTLAEMLEQGTAELAPMWPGGPDSTASMPLPRIKTGRGMSDSGVAEVQRHLGAYVAPLVHTFESLASSPTGSQTGSAIWQRQSGGARMRFGGSAPVSPRVRRRVSRVSSRSDTEGHRPASRVASLVHAYESLHGSPHGSMAGRMGSAAVFNEWDRPGAGSAAGVPLARIRTRPGGQSDSGSEWGGRSERAYAAAGMLLQRGGGGQPRLTRLPSEHGSHGDDSPYAAMSAVTPLSVDTPLSGSDIDGGDFGSAMLPLRPDAQSDFAARHPWAGSESANRMRDAGIYPAEADGSDATGSPRIALGEIGAGGGVGSPTYAGVWQDADADDEEEPPIEPLYRTRSNAWQRSGASFGGGFDHNGSFTNGMRRPWESMRPPRAVFSIPEVPSGPISSENVPMTLMGGMLGAAAEVAPAQDSFSLPSRARYEPLGAPLREQQQQMEALPKPRLQLERAGSGRMSLDRTSSGRGGGLECTQSGMRLFRSLDRAGSLGAASDGGGGGGGRGGGTGATSLPPAPTTTQLFVEAHPDAAHRMTAAVAAFESGALRVWLVPFHALNPEGCPPQFYALAVTARQLGDSGLMTSSVRGAGAPGGLDVFVALEGLGGGKGQAHGGAWSLGEAGSSLDEGTLARVAEAVVHETFEAAARASAKVRGLGFKGGRGLLPGVATACFYSTAVLNPDLLCAHTHTLLPFLYQLTHSLHNQQRQPSPPRQQRAPASTTWTPASQRRPSPPSSSCPPAWHRSWQGCRWRSAPTWRAAPRRAW